jgi:hypothetical protein
MMELVDGIYGRKKYFERGKEFFNHFRKINCVFKGVYRAKKDIHDIQQFENESKMFVTLGNEISH